jgi:hypothetical protein
VTALEGLQNRCSTTELTRQNAISSPLRGSQPANRVAAAILLLFCLPFV